MGGVSAIQRLRDRVNVRRMGWGAGSMGGGRAEGVGSMRNGLWGGVSGRRTAEWWSQREGNSQAEAG